MPLDAPMTYHQMMERDGFVPANHAKAQFFPVELRRLFDDRGVELEGWRRVVRTDTDATLYVHSDSYKLVSNEECFAAFEEALAASSLDTADMRVATDYAAGGARVFRQYLLPGHRVQVKPGVEVALRLLMFNSYDGSVAFTGRSGAYNFVCANTAVSGRDFASFRMRHAGEMDVGKAIKGLTEAAERYVADAARWRSWPEIAVSDLQAIAVFREFPSPTDALTNELTRRWVEARDQDERQGGANLWCLWNVLTAWATHGSESRVQRFEREARVAKACEGATFRRLAGAADAPKPPIIEAIERADAA